MCKVSEASLRDMEAESTYLFNGYFGGYYCSEAATQRSSGCCIP